MIGSLFNDSKILEGILLNIGDKQINRNKRLEELLTDETTTDKPTEEPKIIKKVETPETPKILNFFNNQQIAIRHAQIFNCNK